ncbi:hypothetical protein SAMN02910384_00330 [Pseudobutyrivibrio sp. ACV-2]|uniref:hypothetical protein n=1 Tax=Pseudobutyrivibrio sp. ACV-2 TaxID=1520801 RepID=UPI000895DEFF|nr:hypothetical protein [Pseudobutyrivibrio sp. ACV-2]SDZ85206.1 hypothetical protein SAMN02910384_00330 [Pseudobutyrivibrio sp. ACV-2]
MESRKINTKPVPIVITLAAAFISCVVSIFQRVDFSIFVRRLFIVVLVFMFMGTVIKIILDYSFRTLEPPVSMDAENLGENNLGEDGELTEEEEEAVKSQEG